MDLLANHLSTVTTNVLSIWQGLQTNVKEYMYIIQPLKESWAARIVDRRWEELVDSDTDSYRRPNMPRKPPSRRPKAPGTACSGSEKPCTDAGREESRSVLHFRQILF